MHFGSEALVEAGRWHARRAGDARRGGALARIRVWGLGAARLLYELTLRGFAWAKTPPIYGILLLSGRHFL